LPVLFGADWLVVVGDFSGAVDCVFWADGNELGAEEFELVWLCPAGGDLVLGCSFGDCANAQVPSISPTAVVINKRSLMFRSLVRCFVNGNQLDRGQRCSGLQAFFVATGTRRSRGTKASGRAF
jgi:hypothetical protein